MLHLGTYNGNPLVMAAAKATLAEACTREAHDAATARNDRLVDACQAIIDRSGIPAHTVRFGAKGCVTWSPTPIRNYRDYKATDFDLAFAQWIHGINRGVLLPPGLDEQWLISLMHDDADAMRYADVFDEFVTELTTLIALTQGWLSSSRARRPGSGYTESGVENCRRLPPDIDARISAAPPRPKIAALAEHERQRAHREARDRLGPHPVVDRRQQLDRDQIAEHEHRARHRHEELAEPAEHVAPFGPRGDAEQQRDRADAGRDRDQPADRRARSVLSVPITGIGKITSGTSAARWSRTIGDHLLAGHHDVVVAVADDLVVDLLR